SDLLECKRLSALQTEPVDDDGPLVVVQVFESETNHNLTFLPENFFLRIHRPSVDQEIGDRIVLVQADLVVKGKVVLLDLKDLVDLPYRGLELSGDFLPVGLPPQLPGERPLGDANFPSLLHLVAGDPNRVGVPGQGQKDRPAYPP